MEITKPIAAAGTQTVARPTARRTAQFIRFPLLVAGLCALVGFAALAMLAHNAGPLPGDVEVERFVEAIPWGPASIVLGWVTAFNGTTQAATGIALLVVIVLIRLRAIAFSVLGSLSGSLYTLTNSAVDRPRPSPALVTVTEHLGAHSFPSGHAVFALTFATLLVLCVGGKYLPRKGLVLAAALGAAAVIFISLARLATGGHWPSDVYAGLLLAGGWLLVLLSVRPIGNPVLAWLGDPAGAWTARHPGLPNTIASRWHLLERAFYTPVAQTVERLGFVVRGLLWGVMGFALIAATFGAGTQIDLYGSVRLLVSNPGRLWVAIVIVLAIGGYATWGYVRTVFDPLRRGHSPGGLLARLGSLSSATSYTLVVLFTAGVAFSLGSGWAAGPDAFDLTAAVNLLDSFGAVYVLGAIVFAMGVSQAIDGWREPFMKDVLVEDAPHGLLFHIWTWLGRTGLWARAALFGFLGVLIVTEHWAGQPWSSSFTHALGRMASLPGGAALGVVLGLGLIALGLHSVGAARWMRLRRPVLEPTA